MRQPAPPDRGRKPSSYFADVAPAMVPPRRQDATIADGPNVW